MLTLQQLKSLHDKAYQTNQQSREESADDLLFYWVTQWDDGVLDSSQLQFRGEFNILRKAGRQIISDLNANPVQVDFEPDDDKMSDSSDLMDGIYRSVDRDNSTIDAYDNAKSEAVVCGYGAWELYTEYESLKSGDKNQVIKRKPIYEANNKVFWDPNARLLDKSDAKYCSKLTAYSPEGYREMVEDVTGEDPGEVTPENFASPQTSYAFPWFQGNDTVFVVEFYHRKKCKDKLLTFTDFLGQEMQMLESKLDSVMDELIDDGFIISDEKEVERFKVMKYIASGIEIISSEEISGENIPIVPMYGERAFVKDQEVWQGVTRLAKDPQRLRNFNLSYLADIVSRSPRARPIFHPEQIQGFEHMYDESGADSNYPYNLMNSKDAKGAPLPPGPVGMMPEQSVPPALIAMTAESRQAVEDVANPGLPQDVADPDLSGKAVIALQNRIDMQSMIYQTNLKHAKRRDGEIFAGMAIEIYDAPRRVTLVGADGTAKKAELYQSAIDKETGEVVVLNDLRSVEFKVFSDIGPSYSSQKQQDIDYIINMIGMLGESDPLRNIMILKYAQLSSGNEFKDVRDYANKQLILQGIKEPETEEEQMMLMQAQQSQGQPDAMMLAAMAEMEKAKADQLREQRESNKDIVDAQYKMGKNEIDLYKAETDRMDTMIDAEKIGADIRNTDADTVGKAIDNQQKRFGQIRASLQ